MKKLTTTLLYFISLIGMGQKVIQPTQEITVTGMVKKELTFTLSDFDNYPSKNIPDLLITNHLGEARGTARQLRGILVRDLLKEIELKEENPKRYSEFYFTFVAADNYKVVYSWNEIFNSPTGDNLYIVTSRDGKSLKDMEDRILILTTSDIRTGRRHIKGLSKILVERVQ